MITHYPTAYLFSVDENEETEDGKRVQTFAYADYSGENAPHDHHHAAHDHWEMHKLRQFIEAVVGISATTEVPKPSPPLRPQRGAGVNSVADNPAATGHGDLDSNRQTTGNRGAGWSHAQQQLQVLTRQLADPALMGAGRLALEQQVRALSQAEKGGWTEADLIKLKRDGYLS